MNIKMPIEEIIKMGEGQHFDRKSSKIQINELAETLIAFANADGGTIAIGIEDGKILGINDQANIRINDFIQCSFDECVPPVEANCEFVDVVKDNGKEDRILLIHVEASIDEVHKTVSDEAYLRVGDENKKLNFEQILNLEHDEGGRLFEDEIITKCTIEDLDETVLKIYAEVLKSLPEEVRKILE